MQIFSGKTFQGGGEKIRKEAAAGVKLQAEERRRGEGNGVGFEKRDSFGVKLGV